MAHLCIGSCGRSPAFQQLVLLALTPYLVTTQLRDQHNTVTSDHVPAQAEAPIEKQIARWRQEVFKLLLSSKQAQLAHKQQAEEHVKGIAKLEQELRAAEDGALLLEGRLVDRQVDLDLADVKSKRAEAQLQESCRWRPL